MIKYPGEHDIKIRIRGKKFKPELVTLEALEREREKKRF